MSNKNYNNCCNRSKNREKFYFVDSELVLGSGEQDRYLAKSLQVTKICEKRSYPAAINLELK